MTLSPILAAGPAVTIHAAAAVGAFVLGLIQLTAPKGVLVHRVLGYLWAALMVVVVATSFLIQHLVNAGVPSVAGFSPIHLISIFTAVMLPLAIFAARRGDVKSHSRRMVWMYFGALIVAGLFTFLPGRTMHAAFFGP